MRYSNISWTFILLLCFVLMAEAEYMKYKDPKQPINSRTGILLVG
jgi:beta-glucosidase